MASRMASMTTWSQQLIFWRIGGVPGKSVD
jgi:hypothetical protein